MAKNWQKSAAAALFVAGLGWHSAQASPAGMTSTPRPASTAPAPSESLRIAQAPGVNPSSSPSVWQRISDVIPDVRVPWGSKTVNQAPPAMPGAAPAPMRYESTAQATPTGPVTPQLVVSLAQVSEQQGDIAQARQHYQRALAQWPGQVDLLRAAARMEDRQGQLVVAESLYQQAAAGSPGDAGALNDLGLCLARQGKLEQSVQAFEQAIHMQPDKVRYRNNVATVLVEMRQDSRAIGHMAAVHGTAETQYNMGQLLVARGRASEAEAFFEAALDTNPDMKEASFALTQLSGRTSDGPASQPTPVQSAQAPSMAASNNPTAAPAANSQPPAAPQFEPQFGPQFGPQMSYPSEARTPGYGRSSYMPPAYQPPVVPYAGQPYPANPQPSVPWVGQATPRALPPVGAPQTGVRR